QPQRHYVCLVDGLVSGEGNGPLQALPRTTNWLVFGSDPFAIDTSLAWFMGFQPELIPIINRRAAYRGQWGRFDIRNLQVSVGEEMSCLTDWATNFAFLPPPGWRNYVERRTPASARTSA